MLVCLKHFDNLGVGAPGAPIPLCNAAGGIVGGALSMFGDMLGSAWNSELTQDQMKLQHKLNKQEMAYSQSLNKEYQDFLYNTQYGAGVAGMKNAGLNPAGHGSSLAGASNPGTHTGSAGPSASGSNMGSNAVRSAAAAMEMESMSEDVKSKKLDNKLKTIDVANAEAEDAEFNTTRRYTDPDSGAEISEDDLDQWSKEHPDKIPNIETSKDREGGSKGRLKALVAKSKMRDEIAKAKQNIDDYETRRVANKLDRMVKNGQIDCPEVIDSLVSLPSDKRREINAMVDKLNADKKLISLRAEAQEKSNKEFDLTSLQGVLNKLGDSDASFIEKIGAIALFYMNRKL